jgi:hypothetical protein
MASAWQVLVRIDTVTARAGCEAWGYDYSISSVRTCSISAGLRVLTPNSCN